MGAQPLSHELAADIADSLTMLLKNIRSGPLRIQNWELTPGETWCLVGGNASGKSLLGAILAGEADADSGTIEPAPERVSLLSFESLQAEYERELQEDDSDYLDRIDYGSTGLEILLQSGVSPSTAAAAARRHSIEGLLDRGCRQFSTGELRRIYLLREALREPDLLILDEPYDGLDPQGRDDVALLVAKLIEQNHRVLLIANRIEDVSTWCTHVAVLRQGELIAHGPRPEILGDNAIQHLFRFDHDAKPELPPPPANSPAPSNPLLELRQAGVFYDGKAQFKDLSWRLEPGAHTLITGPNGSGKSTLLGLLTGDHPQCYSNDIRIFGYQRGTGESIWDIKRQLGIVSPALHRDYRVSVTAETAVVSGFYDSIGLYHSPTASELNAARLWLTLFELHPLAQRPFSSLSYGQQRLVLIARGLVKQPPLLILDEPTQGLDDLNRHLVLASLERIATLRRCTLLFVSHRQDERLDLFRHHLEFQSDPSGSARYLIVKRR